MFYLLSGITPLRGSGVPVGICQSCFEGILASFGPVSVMSLFSMTMSDSSYWSGCSVMAMAFSQVMRQFRMVT